ncbi:hypothetical protein BD289DRAFT_500493 [Coniella lustricola]|uniref:Uncharacterized protein n=1 Tax=Coniella lustricola TaxID=2025994 RepID=A0A2T3A6X2_9PEZI|nr:hypothetical protein BD289DRAFT_500493 [Coniella lustricola]
MSTSTPHPDEEPVTAEGTFTADEVKVLETTGFFRVKSSNNKRKVSGLLLTPSDSGASDYGSRSSSAVSSASMRLRGSTSALSTKDFDLPTSSESVAALEFLGFEKPTAQQIFTRWEMRGDPDDYPYSFLEHAIGQFEHRKQNDLSDSEFMKAVGFNQEIREAILDPQCYSVFSTENLQYWMRDTMTSRFATMEHLHNRCHAIASRGGSGKQLHPKKRPCIGLESSAQGGPSITATQLSAKSMSVSTIPNDLNFPKGKVRFGPPAAALHDHLTLYKGRVAHTDPTSPLVQLDGTVRLSGINTRSGGDFNSEKLASYWTPELATAELYRFYAHRRNNYAETWIISIQVPNTFLRSLRKEDLWYGSDWKQYVYLCRRETPHLDIPPRFNKLYSAEVMEGHICSRLPHLIYKIKQENVQSTISEEFLLHCEGKNGQVKKTTQWAFLGGDVVVHLSNAVQGKLHIDVHAADPFP